MSFKDIRLNQLLRIYLDGIPLDLTSTLLPKTSWLKFSLLSHLHLHAKGEKIWANRSTSFAKKISRHGLFALIDSLKSTMNNLSWKPKDTKWAGYYEKDTHYSSNYSKAAFTHKKTLVNNYLVITKAKTVWDLGSNIGLFSRIAAKKRTHTVSIDNDPEAVEINYLECKSRKETNILPLFIDLTNPSPAIGWNEEERMSLIERGPVDTVFALALIHHLAITNNLPFEKIADFFSRICRWLVIEFVPKNDPQLKRMLATREDIFPDYTQESFEKEFAKFFHLQESIKIKESQRRIFLLKKR